MGDASHRWRRALCFLPVGITKLFRVCALKNYKHLSQNLMQKIKQILIGCVLGIILPMSFVAADESDVCGQEFVYVKDSDLNTFSTFPETVDERVLIRYEGEGPGFPDRMVDINNEARFAQDGYVVTKVELDVENDGHDGYFLYAEGPLNNFNPIGDRILSIKVTVKKSCPDVCSNIDGDQYTVPEGYVLDAGQCVLPPSPPLDVCPNIDAIQETIPDGYEIVDGQCVLTPPAPDSTPDPFTFTDQTGVALSTMIESALITVSDINTVSTLSVTGGEYAINGGAYTAVAGTVVNGDTVKVHHTSSASNSTAVDTILTIGGVSDTFTSTTLAAVPNTTSSGGGGGSRRPKKTVIETSPSTEATIAATVVGLTPAEIDAKINELRKQVIALMYQLVTSLQAQLDANR